MNSKKPKKVYAVIDNNSVNTLRGIFSSKYTLNISLSLSNSPDAPEQVAEKIALDIFRYYLSLKQTGAIAGMSEEQVNGILFNIIS